MQRKASALWQGGLKDGKGSLSTDSGVLEQADAILLQHSLRKRRRHQPRGTPRRGPRRLFHHGASAQLGTAGMTAQRLETTATVSLDKVADGFAITKSHLDLVAHIPGADRAKFDPRSRPQRPAVRFQGSSKLKSP